MQTIAAGGLPAWVFYLRIIPPLCLFLRTFRFTKMSSVIPDIQVMGNFYSYNSIICLSGFSPKPPLLGGTNYIVNGSCSQIFIDPFGGNYSLVPFILNRVSPVNVSTILSSIYSYNLPVTLCGRTWDLLVTDMNGSPRITKGSSNYGAYEVDGDFNHEHPFWKSADNDNDEEENSFTEVSGWKLQVYPNPTESGQELIVSLKNGSSFYEHSVYLRLFSIEGVLLFSKTHAVGKFTAEVPHLAPGIYVIRLQTEAGEIYTAKLVVMK